MPFWIASGVFLGFLILESITSWIFIRGSKKKHPKLWSHAGKPTLMGNGDLISAWPLNKYLLQRKYAELGDQDAIAYAERNRLPFVVTYFAACLSVLVFFAVLFLFGSPE
ncbi:MAG: hypothetical protein HWE25_00245 [Alphaproteobacteria bacterium]|nr:hypothetical protein [Alphaproteobacteria bacterium]